MRTVVCTFLLTFEDLILSTLRVHILVAILCSQNFTSGAEFILVFKVDLRLSCELEHVITKQVV